MAKSIGTQVFYYIILAWLVCSCVTDPNFPDEPQIEYIGISKNQMKQSSLNNVDSIFLQFSFTDGDGDIGSEDFNVFLRDQRTGSIYDPFIIPEIPVLGSSKGVSGDVTLRVYTTCCIFPDPNIQVCESPEQYPTDTLVLDIQLFDRAMNGSNIITTEPIIILCD